MASPHPRPPSPANASLPGFVMARWLFTRLLGGIFLCAFTSLGWQIRGLAGAHGIVPAAPWLDAVWNRLGASALWEVPTLCWLSASDAMLVSLCLVGAVLALLLLWGECRPGLCAAGCWLLYLSLCWATQPFLGFQWDALLLESSLLAVIWLPWSWRPDWCRTSLRVQAGRWLTWWLLFRLMFQSGLVKLASNDAAWDSLTALHYHFETQPLPLWTAWLANQLPSWILRLSTGIMFAIEFIAPVLIFLPRTWRHGAAWSLIALQILIAITGNYAFFNFLTIALCVTLFDDAVWPARWKTWIFADAAKTTSPAPPAWAPHLARVLLTIVFLVTIQPLVNTLGLVTEWPKILAKPREWLAPSMSFNGYGLFAIMTTERREIIVEGSNDGILWKAYEFPWKPGNLDRRPGWVAPHQPRLDWQMWFAALGTLEHNPWFLQFLVRLMEGAPPVLDLLETNPFPDRPPAYVRASFYRYHFTRFGDDAHPGWWKREPLGFYCPPITLRDGRPTLVSPSGESR